MRMLEWKTQVAVLWILQTVNYVAYILINLFENEPFGVIVQRSDAPIIAIFFFIPCLMAWASLVSPPLSRWPNIVLGALFALLKLAGALGIMAPLTPAVFINELWGLVAAGLVIWQAWRLPALVQAKD